MDFYTFTLVFPYATMLIVLAGSTVILRHGVLWKWLGWFGLLVVVLGLISPLALLNEDPNSALGIIGFPYLLGFLLWILATSVVIWRSDTLPEPS